MEMEMTIECLGGIIGMLLIFLLIVIVAIYPSSEKD
jgi:hypothetical protein